MSSAPRQRGESSFSPSHGWHCSSWTCLVASSVLLGCFSPTRFPNAGKSLQLPNPTQPTRYRGSQRGLGCQAPSRVYTLQHRAQRSQLPLETPSLTDRGVEEPVEGFFWQILQGQQPNTKPKGGCASSSPLQQPQTSLKRPPVAL